MRGPITATLVLCLAACSGGDAKVDTPAARGEKIYKNICATCHGVDPNHDGTVGPAIAGSSLELVEAKVLHGEYPPGYKPKRETSLMTPLPHLKQYVPDLAAYLQAAAAKGG
jgi:mono/diheme cytochrome c family protein